jgi:predicted DNA-binding mobile mystery protein A
MNIQLKHLRLEQTERKMKPYILINQNFVPKEGWIVTIRKALNISLRQLGNKIGVSAQAIKGLENREATKTITLQSLEEIAKAMDMKLVYGFAPLDGSLENLIARKAELLAKQIVRRTSNTMKLEDQEISKARLQKAIAEKTEELKKDIPSYLWD